MKFVGFKNNELTVTLTLDEQSELQMAVRYYKRHLEDVLSGYDNNEFPSMRESVKVLENLQNEL